MQLSVYVNDTDYSDACLLEQTRISKEISGSVSTAQLSFVVGDQDSLARYDSAHYDADRYAVDVRELYEVKLKDQSGVLQFAGYVTRVAKSWRSDTELELQCGCSDYTVLLEQTVVPEESFSGESDQAIIQYLVSTYCPQLTALTANIEEIVPSIGSWEVKDKTLRAALEELCELTGGEWRVDYEKNLLYFPAGTYPAPFGLSTDAPDGTTNVAYRLEDYTREFSRPINRCTVLGGFIAGAVEISVQYDDPISQAEYGIHSYTIIDREITLASDALLRAKATVDANAYPDESGRAVLWTDGLDVGQTVTILHQLYDVSGDYIIRSMGMSWISKTETEYTIEFGAARPSVERLIRQLDARNRAATKVPMAIPAPGSVTTDSVSSSGLSASVLVGTISGGDITVNAANVIGTISGSSVTVDAGTIQGVITGSNVSVDVSTFQGVIVSSQVADSLIDRLGMYADALRPVPNLASDPTLPSTNYPSGSFYFRTSDSQFRKNNAGTWINATESEAVSGKFEYFHIGTIKAGSIIGLIAAAQIDNITASQITGLISASQITSVNASAIVGTITASQIATVNASAIQGTITASQIASVNASSISGTISASQIASVNASSISGTISATHINSLNAGSITVTGGWTSGQITSVSAGSIAAGTISASVTLTSPTLVISSGTVTVNIDATNKIKVSDSSTVVTAVMDSLGFTVSSAIGTNGYLGPNGWDLRSGASSRLAASAVNYKASPAAITLSPAIFAIFYIDGVPYKFPGYV